MKKNEGLDFLVWRWEFMRRNVNYIDDWNRVNEVRQKATAKPKSATAANTPKKCEESKIAANWGLSSMIDPSICLLEVLHLESIPIGERIEAWAKAVLTISLLDSGNCIKTFSERHEKGEMVFRKHKLGWSLEKSGSRYLHIVVDFTEVNSLPELVSILSDELRFHFSTYTSLRNKGSRKQRYSVDYEILLKVGDMKREGKKNAEIARKLFPRDFTVAGKNALQNPESAIRKIGHYYKKYQKLVDEGFKTLVYP